MSSHWREDTPETVVSGDLGIMTKRWKYCTKRHACNHCVHSVCELWPRQRPNTTMRQCSRESIQTGVGNYMLIKPSEAAKCGQSAMSGYCTVLWSSCGISPTHDWIPLCPRGPLQSKIYETRASDSRMFVGNETMLEPLGQCYRNGFSELHWSVDCTPDLLYWCPQLQMSTNCFIHPLLLPFCFAEFAAFWMERVREGLLSCCCIPFCKILQIVQAQKSHSSKNRF